MGHNWITSVYCRERFGISSLHWDTSGTDDLSDPVLQPMSKNSVYLVLYLDIIYNPLNPNSESAP
jgi:hypothetical protein